MWGSVKTAALGFATALAFIPPALSDIVGEAVTYEVDGKPYEGYFARNTALGDNQPVVLIIHDWDGLDAYEERRAQMLAEQGFAAFAADLYGKGVRPDTVEGRRAQTSALYADRDAMRARLMGALEALKGQAGTDDTRVAAIGYCFGGAAALEMARAGADLKGFVTLHGGLSTPEGQDYKSVKGPVLILHGSNDTSVPMTEVANLATALDEAGIEHRMEIYGGAPHAFTVWNSDRYRAQADIQSWNTMVGFLETQLR